MRAYVSRILFITLMLGCSVELFAHVALDYPVGGETYIQGQTVTIQWHIVAFHQQLNWDLYFSSDGGDTWQPIQLDIPVDSLSYTWVVPAVVTSQGRIKIFQDNVEHDYLDVSGDFNIVPNTSPPSLDAPANDTIIECGIGNQETVLQNWLSDHGGAAATNYCGDLIWTNDYDGLSDDCGMTGSALVTFTATDGCGSTYSVATVTIIDSSSPIMTVFPMNKAVECDGQGNVNDFNAWLNNHGGAQAIDACSNVTWTHNSSPLSNGCGASGSTIISFVATDACGNSAASTATFTIADHLAPMINQTAHDTVIECGASAAQAIQSWLDNHGDAQANDICGIVSWSNNFSSLSDLCGTTGNATVLFTAKDDCGNTATTSANISIQDHIAPVLEKIAKDTIIQCGSSNPDTVLQNWLNLHGGAAASDNCGSVSWTNDFSNLGDGCGPTGSAFVTFTATDDCGNHSTTRANFTIQDTIPPSIDIEARDTTIICGIVDQELIIQHWLDLHGGAQASDICGSVNWTQDYTGGSVDCDSTQVYFITFTAKDDCMNSSTTTASLTLLENPSTSIQWDDIFSFHLYPNPVHDVLIFDPGEKLNNAVNLSLFDSYGILRWFAQEVTSPLTLSIQNFEPGIYFLKISTAKGILTRKIIIE